MIAPRFGRVQNVAAPASHPWSKALVHTLFHRTLAPFRLWFFPHAIDLQYTTAGRSIETGRILSQINIDEPRLMRYKLTHA